MNSPSIYLIWFDFHCRLFEFVFLVTGENLVAFKRSWFDMVNINLTVNLNYLTELLLNL